jgi:hypothetical protein
VTKIEKLVDDALALCNREKYKQVIPALFQRCLSTDFYTGKKVFDELVKLKVISEVKENILDDDVENPLGEIDKSRLREFFLN